jgi:hypothetical protein
MKVMKRLCSTLILAAGLCITAGAEEVIVKIAPPRAVVEKRPARPGAEYVWIPGYHNWDGHAHVWVAGRWERPPRAHQVWVAHKWEHRKGGYVLVEGHWR